MSTREGWAQPLNAKRWHYFDGTISLCGKHSYKRWLIAETQRWEGSRHKDCEMCKEMYKRKKGG